MTELYIRTHIRFEDPKEVRLVGEAKRLMQVVDQSLEADTHLRRLDAVLPCSVGEKRAECLFDTRKWRLDDAKEILIQNFLTEMSMEEEAKRW